MIAKPLPGKRIKKSRKVRLEDIAAECGVSLSTVSRALSGEKGVRDDIRLKVVEAARRVNYSIPAAVAGQKIILAASGAAMIDYVRNQFTLYVLEGLRERALALGLEIVTRPISDHSEEVSVLEEAARDDSVMGVLFLTVDDADMLAATRNLGKPVVLINGDDPFMRLSSVSPCNRSSARVATDHLIRLGHRRVLFLMKPGRRTIERRLEGWRDALRIHGIEPDDDLIVTVDDWLPDLAARAISDRIAQDGLNFTAILAAGDSLAMGALTGVREAGFSVPDDVSVMGMDDLPQTAFLSPPLTTMHIPMKEIGAAALDLLRDGLGLPAMPPRRVELACHLIERLSTGVAKHGSVGCASWPSVSRTRK